MWTLRYQQIPNSQRCWRGSLGRNCRVASPTRGRLESKTARDRCAKVRKNYCAITGAYSYQQPLCRTVCLGGNLSEGKHGGCPRAHAPRRGPALYLVRQDTRQNLSSCRIGSWTRKRPLRCPAKGTMRRTMVKVGPTIATGRREPGMLRRAFVLFMHHSFMELNQSSQST